LPRGPNDAEARALQNYKGAKYNQMNALMRDKLLITPSGLQIEGRTTNYSASDIDAQEQSYEELRGELKSLLNYLGRAPKYPGKGPLFRGVTLPAETVEELRQLDPDQDWEDPAFLSTAQAASAPRWAKDSEFRNRDTIIQIVLPQDNSGAVVGHSGVDMESGAADHNAGQFRENEVLFPPGQRFRVRRVIEGNDEIRGHMKNLIAGEPDALPVTADDPDPYRLQSVKAKTYIVLEAQPYTAEDRDYVERRLETLQPRGKPEFSPPRQPPSRHSDLK
jgi:hypothetical protein